MNSPKKRCESCRRLKIKCDGALPCEYCNATNRQCNYILSRSLVQTRFFSTEPVFFQSSLNSPPRHMGITPFQYRLIIYFHEGLLPEKVKEEPVRAMWQTQVPRLFHESPVVQNCMYSLSTLRLLDRCDLSQWIDPENVTLDTRFFPEPIHDLQSFRRFLQTSVHQFCTKMLADTCSTIEKLISREKVLSTVHEAAEIVFSGAMLFSFLVLQTGKIVPLLNFNPDEPDLISMSFGMRESMVLCFPHLYQSEYSALFHNDPLANFAEKKEFPFVAFLHNHLTELHRTAVISSTKFSHYEESLNILAKLFAAAAKHKSSSILYKWTFCHDAEVYRYMREERDKFALKLLYAYSCLNIFDNFYFHRYNNLWFDYIKSYKTQCMATGGWEDQFDEMLYKLVCSEFLFSDDNYAVLYTFPRCNTLLPYACRPL